MIFTDRQEAGRKLAEKLKRLKSRKDAIVLGIPRGGVEVAFGIAKELKVPLSVVVAKKIGHPYEPEFAIGAVSPDNYIVDGNYTSEAGKDYIESTIMEMNAEIKRRCGEYAKGKLPELKDKIAVIVDDGLATGYTMLAAIKYVKSRNPKKVIVAVPVAAQDSYEKVKSAADEVICLHIPAFFGAVGSFYQDFGQLDDDEVKFYLKEAKKYA